jgi:hypothetical protein
LAASFGGCGADENLLLSEGFFFSSIYLFDYWGYKANRDESVTRSLATIFDAEGELKGSNDWNPSVGAIKEECNILRRDAKMGIVQP